MDNHGTIRHTPKTGRRRLLIAAVAVLAGCSSASGSANVSSSTPSSAAPTSTAAPASSSTSAATAVTTPASTTTVAPASTTTIPATTTPIATPTTEAAPTTTISPIEAAVRQAFQDYLVAAGACGDDPASCDATTFTAAGSIAQTNSVAYYKELVHLNLHTSADTRGSYAVIESVTFVSNNEATVVTCGYDAGIMLGLPGPDGQPTVVNDEIVSSRGTSTMELQAGRWLLGKADAVRLGEGNLCPPQA